MIFHTLFPCRLTLKVDDGLPARISERKSNKSILTQLLRSQGWQTVGEGQRGNDASHDLADLNPGAAEQAAER